MRVCDFLQETGAVSSPSIPNSILRQSRQSVSGGMESRIHRASALASDCLMELR